MAEARHAEALRIGRLIASLRERKGWNQEDLAHEIQKSTSTVSRWERGLHQGYASNVRRLAEVLEVEPAILLPASELFVGSQLDRMERRLDEIYELLSGEAPGTVSSREAAEIVAESEADIAAAAGAPPGPKPARRGKTRAASRRTRA